MLKNIIWNYHPLCDRFLHVCRLYPTMIIIQYNLGINQGADLCQPNFRIRYYS